MTKCPRKTMIFHREFPIILTTLSKIEYRPVSNHAVLSMQNHDFELPWRDFLSKIVLFYRKFVAIPYTLKKNQILTQSAGYSVQTTKKHIFVTLLQYFQQKTHFRFKMTTIFD